jgi:mediator of RNA polymerase II transcription subunit 22
MQRPRDDFQTDALRPAALPTASLKPGGVTVGGNASLEDQLDQSSEAYLDSIYEDWNKKVDVEVETLVEGMVDLVNISNIGNKDKFRVAQEAFEAQCMTESMVITRCHTSLAYRLS